MALRVIDRKQWKTYFDTITRLIGGDRVEVEVAGLDIGDQIEEDWAPLDGITYDERTNTLFVHTPGLDHAIQDPRDIIASENGTIVRSIAVKDGDGHVQALNFREPLKLPAAHEAPQHP